MITAEQEVAILRKELDTLLDQVQAVHDGTHIDSPYSDKLALQRIIAYAKNVKQEIDAQRGD